MMLQFDERGYLFPYEVTETDLALFEQVFVSGFPQSSTRKRLFESYEKFLTDLREIVKAEFYQWVDGSFVTRKVGPKDIDVVTFLDYRVHEAKEKELYLLKRQYSGEHRIDCYFVKLYPQDHKKYFFTMDDSRYWLDFFTNTRKNLRTGKKSSKGFIKLNYLQ